MVVKYNIQDQIKTTILGQSNFIKLQVLIIKIVKQVKKKKIIGVKTKTQKVDVLQHCSLKHANLVEIINYDSNYQEIWYN